MRAVFLVPRRDDNGHRDRLWAWCRARWERYMPDVPVYEGHHTDGLFNRSAGINTAARLADADGRWDVGVVIDSDVFLRVSQVRAAIESAADGKVTWAHRRWREFSEAWTLDTLKRNRDFGPELELEDMDVLVERTNRLSWSCCIAIPRATFDDMGGFDERFRGWGWEDMAFQSLATSLYPWAWIEGDVLNLWHPRSPERIVKGQPRSTASEAYITNARLGRRYMVAARRDHGVHDRPQASDAEELARDIANLREDDARWSVEAQRIGLPDWDNWWPTLEELRDGAKEHRNGPPPGVAVIVRTGGAAETWPERSAYLRTSLASLSAQVTGTIVQRVLYADWADEFRPELSAIAAEHGFYVAGEGHHGYTESVRRLWKYIARRVRAPYVFLAEDDFTYDRPVDLGPMVEALDTDRDLAQVALLRAPCYAREMEGGILGWPEEAFTPRDQGNGHGRLEHRLFWTMNPSLIRRTIADQQWPQAASSERVFGDRLLRNPQTRFAFWGDGTPWIGHLGEVRAVPGGAGY